MRTLLVLYCFCFSQPTLSAQDILYAVYDYYRVYDASKTKSSISENGVQLSPEQVIKRLSDKMLIPDQYELFVSKNESSYRPLERIDNNNEGRVNRTITISLSEGNGLLYKNLQDNSSLHVASGYDKDFLIKEDLKTYDWKLIRGETKTIMGYEVKKATAIVDSIQVIEAWYAPSLAYTNGPSFYHGLPGLILELKHSLNDAANFVFDFRLKEVAVGKPKDKVEKPKKGQVVNKIEYKAAMEALINRQREMMNQGVDAKL